MNDSGERMIPGKSAPDIEEEHWARYRYASTLVANKATADVACGTGYGTRLLADAGAASIVGVDLDPEAVSYASDHYLRPGVSFLEGSAENLSMLESGQFDVVVSFETIEHLRDVNRYLSEIWRILRPNGTFLVSTPDRRLASVLFPFIRRPQNRYHVREFTQKELVELLSSHFIVHECLGQVPIHKLFVFWPIQFVLKSLGRIFRSFGGARLKEAVYGDARGAAVERVSSRAWVPKYWVFRCERRSLATASVTCEVD
jgi:ubiquinone/menaquinone biosynthesis C-methylase UbiE